MRYYEGVTQPEPEKAVTDDAYARGYDGCDPFLPGEDYDPMYEGPGDGTYRCGRGEYRDIPCCCGDEGRYVGPGCRHCCPPDHEAKPYGFGIETFEHEPSLRMARELQANWPLVGGGPIDRLRALELARKWAGFSYRRLRHSQIVWERLCCECETHGEAVARYEECAKRAAGVKYRDEHQTH